jgi:hypothetical protein
MGVPARNCCAIELVNTITPPSGKVMTIRSPATWTSAPVRSTARWRFGVLSRSTSIRSPGAGRVIETGVVDSGTTGWALLRASCGPTFRASADFDPSGDTTKFLM